MNMPNKKERQKPAALTSYAEQWMEKYEKDFQKPPQKFMTGIKILDLKLLGGFLPGQLVTVGGLPAAGKTAFCLNVAANLGEKGQKVLIYNFEMSYDSLFSRVISQQQNIRLMDILERRVPPSQFKLLSSENKTALSNLNFCDPANLSLDKIYEDIDFVLDGDLEGKFVLIFDYLQRMPILSTRGGFIDVRIKINENLAALKDIARERDGLVIAVSALNREAAKSGITMSAFRESGEFEYASDAILALATAKRTRDGKWVEATGEEVQEIRAEDVRQTVLLKFLKVKHFREGECILTFERDYQKFEPFHE